MLGPVAMEVNTMVAVGQMATLKCEPGEQRTRSLMACYLISVLCRKTMQTCGSKLLK